MFDRFEKMVECLDNNEELINAKFCSRFGSTGLLTRFNLKFEKAFFPKYSEYAEILQFSDGFIGLLGYQDSFGEIHDFGYEEVKPVKKIINSWEKK
jgi:hypothetical protein